MQSRDAGWTKQAAYGLLGAIAYGSLGAILSGLGQTSGSVATANEDIEFASEHLGEVGLENRLAALPLWGVPDEGRRWSTLAQLGYTSAASDSLTVEGPMLSGAIRRALSDRWSVGAFAFYDRFELTSGTEHRPLQTLFAPEVPIARPVDAQFSNLDGRAVNRGLGIMAALHSDRGWLGEHRWVAAVSWQRIELSDFIYRYQVLQGPDSGIAGTLDFSATYHNLTALAGLELLRDYGNWTLAPRVQFTLPTPRRGFAGRITGPGFDIAGDSASAGNGAHFGDSSFALGLLLTYRPAHLSIDIGSTIAQAVLIPVNKSGIDKNIALSLQWGY